MRRAFLCILAAAALSGCATVVFSDEGGRQMVDIVNTGWYFLNFVPMASGNPDAPNECSCRIFRQTTTLENNVRLLERAIAERGAVSAKSISSYWTDESVFFILFKRHSCHTSAELVMPPEAPQDDGLERLAARRINEKH